MCIVSMKDEQIPHILAYISRINNGRISQNPVKMLMCGGVGQIWKSELLCLLHLVL